MPDSLTSPTARTYPADLREALHTVAPGVRGGILDGVGEELDGLDEADPSASDWGCGCGAPERAAERRAQPSGNSGSPGLG
ncbi:MAG: hypothetical protein H7146_13960 [Burkholderiaceae bacterium]|nr:hypothetical protein [Microbacteriaceae bacterium]